MVRNILTIDVEEVYYSEYTRKHRERVQEFSTPSNILSVLELLKKQDVKATFFVVGEIAQRFPEVTEMILKQGHEVAFHGWTHLPLWRINPRIFREEIRAFKNLCPTCKGYRAPHFSIRNKTKWALKVLQDERLQYDSSIFPTWTPLYGVYNAPARPYRPSLTDLTKEDKDGALIEFPLAVGKILGLKIPIAGGFWLRFFDLTLIGKSIRRINRDNNPAVIYTHNWELQPNAQRLPLHFFSKFITYHNAERVREKILHLLRTFPFTSFSEYLDDQS